MIPLLQEYFYNDVERLSAVLGQFIQPAEFEDDTRKSLKDLCDLDRQYGIKVFEPDQPFLAALQQLT